MFFVWINDQCTLQKSTISRQIGIQHNISTMIIGKWIDCPRDYPFDMQCVGLLKGDKINPSGPIDQTNNFMRISLDFVMCSTTMVSRSYNKYYTTSGTVMCFL